MKPDRKIVNTGVVVNKEMNAQIKKLSEQWCEQQAATIRMLMRLAMLRRPGVWFVKEVDRWIGDSWVDVQDERILCDECSKSLKRGLPQLSMPLTKEMLVWVDDIADRYKNWNRSAVMRALLAEGLRIVNEGFEF